MANHGATKGPRVVGLLAEFGSQQDLLAAARKVRDAGFTRTDAFSPYPIEEMIHALGKRETRIPWFIFCCGLTGFLSAVGLQVFTSVIDYPWNIGGRPLFSWPMFIPISFELTVLLSGFGAVFGMLAFNSLPQHYHPLFNVPEFAKASRNGFFLEIENTDPKFNLTETGAFLRSLHPTGVYEVKDV